MHVLSCVSVHFMCDGFPKYLIAVPCFASELAFEKQYGTAEKSMVGLACLLCFCVRTCTCDGIQIDSDCSIESIVCIGVAEQPTMQDLLLRKSRY